MEKNMPYIHFTEEQKLRAANVDLEQFLLAQGEELIYRNREIRLRTNHSVLGHSVQYAL